MQIWQFVSDCKVAVFVYFFQAHKNQIVIPKPLTYECFSEILLRKHVLLHSSHRGRVVSVKIRPMLFHDTVGSQVSTLLFIPATKLYLHVKVSKQGMRWFYKCNSCFASSNANLLRDSHYLVNNGCFINEKLHQTNKTLKAILNTSRRYERH